MRLLRIASLSAAIVFGISACGWSQYYGQSYGNNVQAYQPQWAASLFAQPRHDFGDVARGSEQSHVFEFVNPLKKDIVIGGYRVSCKCAEPTILTPRVKPGEKGQVKVRLNTLAFIGKRHSRITLTVQSPDYTELYLDIDGHVRQDVVVNPGQVDFSNQAAGQDGQRTVDIQYRRQSQLED